jgi:hypothetical protein
MRPIRDCEHKRARHKHGHYLAYVLDQCRCDPCTAAQTAREAARAEAKRLGTYDSGRVDAGPVREHIEGLRAKGYGLKTIAKLAGVSNATLGKIIYGDASRGLPPRARVERHVAERVRAVQPSLSTLGQTIHVKSKQTQDRIKHLACLGYPLGWIARRLGREHSNLGRLRTNDMCNAKTARQIRDLYLLLWDKPRLATNRFEATAITRCLTHAKSQGWELLPAPHLTSLEAPVNPDPHLERFLQERMERQVRRRA